jgi:hypothetical protein
MKLIIAGSRTFTDYQLLCQTLALERSRITQVITGGARGADQLGYRWAWKHPDIPTSQLDFSCCIQ